MHSYLPFPALLCDLRELLDIGRGIVKGAGHPAVGLDRRTRWTMASGEQVGASLRELHIGAGLVLPQPALFNGVGEASTIFGGGATVAK